MLLKDVALIATFVTSIVVGALAHLSPKETGSFIKDGPARLLLGPIIMASVGAGFHAPDTERYQPEVVACPG